MASKNVTLALAAGAAGVGGYYAGSSMDASSPPSSTITAKSVLIPGLAGVLGYFLLKRKNHNAAKGLLIGGLAGAAYGYYKRSSGAGATPGGYAGGGYGGYGSYGAAAYLGAPPRAVRKILNSPRGSGISSILPKRLQSGAPAFPSDAWKR